MLAQAKLRNRSKPTSNALAAALLGKFVLRSCGGIGLYRSAVVAAGGSSLEKCNEPVSKDDLAVAEAAESAAKGPEATGDQTFANKLAKRSPPNEVERAEIKRARK